MNHDDEVTGSRIPEATIETFDLDFVEILGEDIDDEVFDTESCTGSIFEELALAELVQRVIGHGTINRETNALCAKILNHPEVHMRPEVLPLYASENGVLHYVNWKQCICLFELTFCLAIISCFNSPRKMECALTATIQSRQEYGFITPRDRVNASPATDGTLKLPLRLLSSLRAR